MGKLQFGFLGRLNFEDVDKRDAKKMVDHVSKFAGVTVKPGYLKGTRTLCVVVAGDLETELSLMALAAEELEQIRKRSGAERYEFELAD